MDVCLLTVVCGGVEVYGWVDGEDGEGVGGEGGAFGVVGGWEGGEGEGEGWGVGFGRGRGEERRYGF